MSAYSNDPTRHDLFVSLGINMVSQLHPGVQPIAADGRLPLAWQAELPCPPAIHSYRPDAILAAEASRAIHLLEVKSYGDLSTAHSVQQFRVMGNVLLSCSDAQGHLVVFDVPSTLGEADLSDELQVLRATGRLQIHLLSDEGVSE